MTRQACSSTNPKLRSLSNTPLWILLLGHTWKLETVEIKSNEMRKMSQQETKLRTDARITQKIEKAT